MATKRKTITKKTRFEVFKRDSFKCQYCGASAPEAVLVVDHIAPVSKNGANEIINYITACQPCNAGKSDRELSDKSVIHKQKEQLDQLNERREQIEMMMEWRSGLTDIRDQQIAIISKQFKEYAPGYYLNESGLLSVKRLLREYAFEDVLNAMETSFTSYLQFDDAGKPTSDSVSLALTKIKGVLVVSKLPEDRRRLHYIKGIIRNRYRYMPPDIMNWLNGALEDGWDIDSLETHARKCNSWTHFRDGL